MTRFFALALIALLAAAPASASVIGSIAPAALSVDDGLEPVADVWAFSLTNETDSDINAITLTLNAADFGAEAWLQTDGGFYNPSELTFGPGALPEFRGFPITDTFVVLPEGLDPLAAVQEFGDDRINTSYTVSGGILVGAGETVTVAHLSVAAGTDLMMPRDEGVTGSVVDLLSVQSPIVGIPEPTSAILVGLALVGFAARRNG